MGRGFGHIMEWSDGGHMESLEERRKKEKEVSNGK